MRVGPAGRADETGDAGGAAPGVRDAGAARADQPGLAGVAQAGVDGGRENARFRATLLRVLLVQAVALALLGLLQALYHG